MLMISMMSQSSLLQSLMPFNGINPHSIVQMDNYGTHHVDTIHNVPYYYNDVL